MKNIGRTVDAYTPKYNQVELMVSYNWLEMEVIGKMSWYEVRKRYPNRMILSFKDYDDTKTTSVIIEGE